MSKFRKISGKLMIFPFNTLVSSWFLSIRVVWASKYGRFSITKLPKMSTFFEKSPHLWCSQLSQNVDIFKKSLRPQYPQTIQNIDIFRNMSTSIMCSNVQKCRLFSKKSTFRGSDLRFSWFDDIADVDAVRRSDWEAAKPKKYDWSTSLQNEAGRC